MVVASKEWLDHEAEDIKLAKGLTMSEQLANQANANENSAPPQTTTIVGVSESPSPAPPITLTQQTPANNTVVSADEQNEADTLPLLCDELADEQQFPAPTQQKEFDEQQKKMLQQQLLAQQREQQQLLHGKQQIQQSPTPLPTPQSTPVQTPLSSPQQSPQTTLKQQSSRASQKSMTAPKNNASSTIDTNKGVRVFLICQPNSHPFVNRNIVLEPNQEVKVGRFITRNKISENNAIFDCKVLSRNHALIWLSDGKYYIRDTASSNGTFVNNQRLSLTGVLSKPFEVNTGDVVQFGVDVLENSRKETHGCIVALLNFCSLDSPDAKGLKTDELMKKSMLMQSLPASDLYRLNTYVQETVHRDNNLETTMVNLQKIVEATRRNSAITWHSMIEEDRLLSRIDILENKLQYFQKNMTADKLRNETLKLQDDKAVYQSSAKEALRKVYQERTEAITKLCTIERALCNSEDECSLLRDQLLKTQQNFQDVTAMLADVEEKTRNQHQLELQELNKRHVLELSVAKDLMEGLLKEKNDLLERVELYERFSSNVSDDDDNQKLAWSSNKVHSWMTKLEKDVYTSIYNKKDDSKADDTEDPAPSTERATLLDIEKHIKHLENLQGQLSLAKSQSVTRDNDNSSDIGVAVVAASTTTTSTNESDAMPNENNKSNVTESDGNQNNTECAPQENGQTIVTESDAEVVKQMTVHLLDAYVKLRGQLLQLLKLQEKPRVPKNLFDDLESQLACSQLEVHSLKCELMARPSTLDFDNLVGECVQLRATMEKAQTQPNEMHIQNETAAIVFQRNANDTSHEFLQVERDQPLITAKIANGVLSTTERTPPEMLDKGTDVVAQPTSESASQTDLIGGEPLLQTVVVEQQLVSESFKSVTSQADIVAYDDNKENNVNVNDGVDELITADDIAMLNNPDVQREEELVAFKENCARLLEDNSQMKTELIDLQTRLSHATPMWTTLMYVMPFIAVIGYLLISPYS